MYKERGIQLRARNRAHLEALKKRLDRLHGRKKWKIEETPNNDYGWRIRLSRTEWTAIAYTLAEEIVWPNFKDECKKEKVDLGYEDALHAVWHQMMRYQMRVRRPADAREYAEWQKSRKSPDVSGIGLEEE